jgi:hypothetical protein
MFGMCMCLFCVFVALCLVKRFCDELITRPSSLAVCKMIKMKETTRHRKVKEELIK